MAATLTRWAGFSYMNRGREAESPTPSPESAALQRTTNPPWMRTAGPGASNMIAEEMVSVRPMPVDIAALMTNFAQSSSRPLLGEASASQKALPSRPTDESEMML